MFLQPCPSVDISFLAVMSIHTPVTATWIYFITFAYHEWLQLIELVKGYGLAYKWFDLFLVNIHTVHDM